MLLAYQNGIKVRVEASRGSRGICPVCEKEVLAKCGPIKIDHWAHVARDCDPWSEPESEWHIKWKRIFPIDWREVTMGPHRCDIKTPRFVVELQHSSISPEEIKEREDFYGDMVWLFDLRDVADNLSIRDLAEGAFTWTRKRERTLKCRKPVFYDIGQSTLVHAWDYVDGSGQYQKFSKLEFLQAIGAISGTEKDHPEVRPFAHEKLLAHEEKLKAAEARRLQGEITRAKELKFRQEVREAQAKAVLEKTQSERLDSWYRKAPWLK